MTLEVFFAENPRVALGFSGGVDSSYLLYAALRYGTEARPYFVKTPFQPAFELEDARRLAASLGAELRVLSADILADAQIAANPPERCYYCKRAIFSIVCRQALTDGFPLVIDGSNASDDAADRPGMKALTELSVRSPLRDCGLAKAEVRRLSREAGLFTWDKPAYACLATRIPPGRPITKELLERVERAEDALTGLGFHDFRVRVLGEAARLQVPDKQIDEAAQKRTEIRKALEPYFTAVFLDLEGR